MDVKGYSPLEGSQEDINRRLLHMIEEAESGDSAAIKALQDEIGDDTTANTILKRLKDVETTVGNSSSGLVKTVGDHTTAIGKASGEGAGGILKDVADIKSAIGDEDTAASILGRIKIIEEWIAAQ